MYKRRIDSLENKVQELQQIIISNKKETDVEGGSMESPVSELDEETRNLLAPLFNNNPAFVVTSSTMPEFVTQHELQEPLEIIDEDGSSVESASSLDEEPALVADALETGLPLTPQNMTAGEVISPVDIAEEVISPVEIAEEVISPVDIAEEVISPVEIAEEVISPVETAVSEEVSQKNEDAIIDSIDNRKLELKQINSMNVADLRKHLEEYGIAYTKSMKKPDLRKMLISSST
ncbi:MAG: hypothetical protein CML47_01880 [Rhodobacteraceae bacterium]|nr:MAG: hypothetical protein CML47_01880 [Paracoccaceae bacterium]